MPQGGLYAVGVRRSLVPRRTLNLMLTNTIINTGHMMATFVPIHSLPVAEVLYS